VGGEKGWRLEAGDRRLEAGGWRLEAGGWRLEAGGWRLETGGWRPEAGDRRLETGGRRQSGVGSCREVDVPCDDPITRAFRETRGIQLTHSRIASKFGAVGVPFLAKRGVIF
jgi:hypothetical protein